MKENIKKIIIFIILVIILLSTFIIILVIKNNNNVEKNIPGNEIIKPTYKLEKIKSISNYMTINNCINTYLKYINNNEKEALNYILIADYKDNNNINDDIKNIKGENEFFINKVLTYNANISINTYLVSGEVFNKSKNQLINVEFLLNIDNVNSTFEIAPLGKVFKDYINLENDDFKIDTSIDKKINNISKNNYNSVEIVNGLRRERYYKVLF